MQIFENTDGKKEQSYGDDVIQLRFKCSKRKNEHPKGEFALLLSALKLSEDNYLWDVKNSLWQALEIDEKPIKLAKERHSIAGRNINNAADIPILRNKEGKLLLSALGLRGATPVKYAAPQYHLPKPRDKLWLLQISQGTVRGRQMDTD
jgi:hypothetical protein